MYLIKLPVSVDVDVFLFFLLIYLHYILISINVGGKVRFLDLFLGKLVVYQAIIGC